MKAETIAEVLALYEKHGWNLRRALLSDALRVELTDRLQDLFGGAEIVSSKLDALWFSRFSKQGEAWELRRLGGAPFALVAVFDDETDAEEREAILRETEARMTGRKD